LTDRKESEQFILATLRTIHFTNDCYEYYIHKLNSRKGYVFWHSWNSVIGVIISRVNFDYALLPATF